MNGHDDEVWLDSLLQRQLPSGLPDEGFQARLLQRLPRRPRPVLRLLILGAACGVAAVPLIISAEVAALSSSGPADLAVPFSLGTALFWYLVDCLG
ncbi:hypothetical protein JRI60_15455 [Archangium violaceum]|uniref:hypothetical protein n=1 Tax=Archangium violaceum TaxID=83451 RepID=UPI001951AD55|nr:hypothetical protein [Archangium violaceum]QRO00320.1 hypothetical protein JRI60_15455 [Archangium violaceum]